MIIRQCQTLQQISGLHDQHTGGVHTRGFTTAGLYIEIVEKNWKRIQTIEELPTPPLMVIGALDTYTDE